MGFRAYMSLFYTAMQEVVSILLALGELALYIYLLIALFRHEFGAYNQRICGVLVRNPLNKHALISGFVVF